MPPGPFAVGATERVDVDAVGTAVHGVRRGVSCFRHHLRTLDHLHESRISRVGLRVDDVNARADRARHHEKSPLDVRVRRVGAEMRAARVPAEVVQFVAAVRQLELTDESSVGRGCRVGIDDAKCVLLAVLAWCEQRDVRERLRGAPRRPSWARGRRWDRVTVVPWIGFSRKDVSTTMRTVHLQMLGDARETAWRFGGDPVRFPAALRRFLVWCSVAHRGERLPLDCRAIVA